MPSKNVELVRRIYDRWAEGDFRAGRELLDPNVTTVWAQEFPTAGIYRGPEGHASAMREWLSAWTDFRLEAERFVDLGDSVVVPFVVRARGRESGADVERRWAHVWTLHNGRLVRFEVHLDVGEALRAAEPQESS
jgi:ketosteroid isomerase-like protein